VAGGNVEVLSSLPRSVKEEYEGIFFVWIIVLR
jgi:hypothetical protein